MLRRPWLIFVALVLLALVIRLAWLGRKSIWLDEVYTIYRSGLGVEQIIAMSRDATPPLFYLGMHYWLALGQSELVLRLPSAIFGAIAPGLCYLLGRRWAGEWTGMAAAILVALAPIHAWSSQEARMYAMASTFGLLSVYSLTEAIRTGRWFWWIGWVIGTLVTLYLHYSGMLLLLVEAVLLLPACKLARVSSRRLLTALLALCLILFLYAPWAQRVGVQFMSFGVPFLWYFDPIARILGMLGIRATTADVFNLGLLVGVVSAVLFTLLAWKATNWWRQNSFPMRVGIGAALILIYAGVLIFSALPRGYSVRRQVAIFLPYLLLATAWGISALVQRTRLVSVMILLTVPLLFIDLALIEWQDWRSTSTFLSQQAQPQDFVLLSAPYYDQTFNYYFYDAVETKGIVPSDLPADLGQRIQAKARVWLVLCADVYTDPRGEIPAWLEKQRALIDQYSFPGIRVRLYGPPYSGAWQ
jgi:uncharacterized membrane protein